MTEQMKIWIATYTRIYTSGNHSIAESAANAASYAYQKSQKEIK